MTAIATQTINLDLRPHFNRQNNCIVYCSQYDNDLRNVVVNIADAGTAVNVSTYTIYIEGTKPDKKGFSYELTDIGGTVSNNVVTFPLQLQMTACAGITNAELVFYSGDDRVGSSNFILAVEKAGLADDIDVSETDIPAYVDGAQQAAAEAEQAKETAVSAAETAQGVLESIPEDYSDLSNDVDDLKSALDQAIEEFAVPTQEAVDNWLNAHPEATTTVQDGAITAQKLNAALLPYVINGAYIITSINGDLGAKVNAALQTHNAVVVPYGDYTLEQPIIINGDYKTLIVLGKITYSGNDFAVKLLNSRFCKVAVKEIVCANGSCFRVQADSALCQLNEIHSEYLDGKICVDINATGSSSIGTQHISIYSNFLRASEKGISITSSGTCWCGEIKFFSGEISGTNAIGMYTNGTITAIRAYGLGCENLATALELNGNNSECTFYGCRVEDAGKFVINGNVNTFVFDGSNIQTAKIDLSNAGTINGMIYRGLIYGTNGVIIGTEYEITPDKVGYPKGSIRTNKAYQQIYQGSGTIGGDITDQSCPRVARIVAAGTYALSPSYAVNGITDLIIYAERAGITVTNYDGTKTLFTTTDAQSAWHVYAADVNGYFSPSGYVVEKITLQ